MRKLIVLATLAVVGASSSAFAADVWYNGDFAGANGTYSCLGPNGFGSDIVSFDDFTWNSAGLATYVRGTMIGSTNFAGIWWEIRTGMGVGSNGTIVANGFAAATNVNIGSAFGATLYATTANITPTALTNGGSYWLGIAVDNRTGTSGLYGVGWSTGTGGVGTPIGGDNALYMTGGATNSASATDGMSFGIGTTPVPEPASMAALGLGAIALIRRRRK
jgi:hypothetical protein